MTLNEYSQEVLDYMVKKLPDVNPATLCEIAEFFAMKTSNYTSDMIVKNGEWWLKHIESNNKLYLEMMKRCK